MILKGKTAIVTGASSGLGSAIATGLIQKGAIVFGIGRNIEKLNNLKTRLRENFHPVVLDISDGEAIKSWLSKQFSKEYFPQILINNAGIGSYHKIDETNPDEWHRMVSTNLNSLFYMTSGVSKLMKTSPESCHIINIGSILGKVGRSESSAYCATKFGAQGFSEALFLELRNYNIKVTSFNPGSIQTDFFKSSGIESHSNMLQTKDLADTLIHILETPDNMLINDITIRPLNPKIPEH